MDDIKLKLSQAAVDKLLHIIAEFDRERNGIPHNYLDLERSLLNTDFKIKLGDEELHIINEEDNKQK